MQSKNFINNILVAASSILIYHHYIIYYVNQPANSSSRENVEKAEKAQFSSLESSIWCRGEDSTHRLCRFKNLCYRPDNSEFIFLHGEDSIVSGIKISSYKEFTVELSSVEKHNGMQLSLVDIPAQSIREMKKIIHVIEGTSFLMMRFKPNNVMHVFHDDLLPLHSTLMELDPKMKEPGHFPDFQLIFADNFAKGSFWELYQLFTAKMSLLLSDFKKDDIYCFQDVYAGLNRNTIWYQYGFNKPQSPWSNRTVTAKEIKRFTSHLLQVLHERIIPFQCPSSNLSVILSRKKNRLILNEEEIKEVIAKETNTQVAMLSLDDTSLVDVISHIRCAKFMTGMHGALLVLGMFLPPGSVIIELFPYAIPPEDYTPYKTMATIPGMGLTYKSWTNTIEKNTVSHPDREKDLGGIGYLPTKVQEQIKKEVKVLPHLCCHDPSWLFRIYQDTIVDVSSFREVVQQAIKESSSNENRAEGEMEYFRNVKLFPGKVQNLACEKINEDNDALVSWTPPWNLEIISTDVAFYEVWMQFANHQDYSVIATNYTNYVILDVNEVLNVWVRCKVNNRHGLLRWIKCDLKPPK